MWVARQTLVLGLLALIAPARAFECGDGASFPDSYVGDDYCDCADGSDEVTTGACERAPFVCPSRPHRAKTVFASRVNDGLCDCCDGTDEWHTPGLCPNTCVQEAAKDMDVLERSVEAKATRESEGAAAAEERAARLAEARATVAANEPALLAARAAKAASEADEARLRGEREARLAAGEVGAALRLADLSDAMLGTALVRLALAQEVTGVDLLHDVLSASAPLKEAMQDVDSADMIEVAMEAKEAGAPRGDDGASAHEAELRKLLPLKGLGREALRAVLDAFTSQTGQTALLARISAALLAEGGGGLALDASAVEGALTLLAPFAHAEADEARKRCGAIEKADGAARATLAELEPVEALRSDFGASHEWLALHTMCYTTDVAQTTFAYNLCPFATFTQDGRSLGKYAGWADAPVPALVAARDGGREPHGRYMAFDGGEDCNGTPRKAAVYFECGEEDSLQSVSEPSVCAYEAWFSSPSACTIDGLLRKHEALQAAAAEAGLPYVPSAVLRSLLGL